jgi:sarcosine oxidase subunit alpha
MTGFAGDTLASALLAAGELVVGRSFKYHRPRGFLSAGAEEPNGLFTLGRARHATPSIPGTTLELRDGLHVTTQNAWPSVQRDVMSINDRLSPLLQTGFYYKTFMGPFRKSWMAYEPFIRRAAGLGRAAFDRDTQRYEAVHEFCDCVIIGAGPAGLAAALAAGRSGARVVLVDQDFVGGGQTLSSSGSDMENWRHSVLAELEQLANVSVRYRTVAAGVYDGNQVILLESPAGRVVSQRLVSLRALAIVFATGAIERPLVFSGNDTPGVMLASALRTYLNRFALCPAERALIVTNNDSAYEASFDLANAGVAVTVVDHRQIIPSDLLSKSAMLGMAIFPGTGVQEAFGRSRSLNVQLAGAHSAEVECDVLGMSGGWSPAVHLTCHGGSRPRYNEEIAAFVPGDLAQGHFAAGAVMGEFDVEACIAAGQEAGVNAAAHAGFQASARAVQGLGRKPRSYHILPVWQPVASGKGKAFVDFQNDVTLADVKSAHLEGYEAVEHLKRYTTLGMGTDQGKTANVNAIGLMAGYRDIPIQLAGTTTFRPPYTGMTIGAIVGRATGQHFRPTRRSPLHAANERHGATFIEAGLWKRAWYYAWAGNSPETAYVREMELVRSGVGLADVSTLGKIDIQGKDAAEFLNRVYVNGFAKLPVGKARYGVMLNDDGVVLDDGTTTRLADDHFYMTTTTAQAGEVMSWLEYLLQLHWTDLDVHVTSLTDEWAGMALSGPKSRDALQLAFPDADVSNPNLPYMGCLDILHEGVRVRLLRLSFSGELAYEVHVPADYADSLWEHLLKSASALGIRPYGLEALASLRIEKGHVAGLELDHRNTLDDLGLGRMAGKEKSYIGKELRFREALQEPDRWSLVGLELMEPEKKLRGGAILFALSDEIKGHGRGYITSVTWSTELQKFIALGLYQGGLKHEGDEIIAAFPLKGEQVRLKLVSPHFIDKAGERLNA